MTGLIIIGLFFLSILLMGCASTLPQSQVGQIYQWVQDETGLAGPEAVPPIVWCNADQLYNIWDHLTLNSSSYKELGEEEGQLYRQYIKESKICGLFDRKSMIIYMGNFHPAWEVGSIVAHELMHYLQWLNRDTSEDLEYYEWARAFRWESQAYGIQDRYLEKMNGGE